jgi:hypothetical protein
MPINHATPRPIQVAAAVIGNALEWHDFIIFGFLTVIIAGCADKRPHRRGERSNAACSVCLVSLTSG